MSLRVLVACEESQAVCKAFRDLGHEAFSCDILDPSGGHPEWHIKGDVLPLINGDCSFETLDTHTHTHTIRGPWDLIIAHPPCTDLAVSGAAWFPEKQKDYRQQKACVFFMQMALAQCKRVAVENPVGIMSSCYRRPDQIIHPWQFALTEVENTEKKTCLWLRGLPKLVPVHLERPEIEYVEFIDKKTGRKKRQTRWYYDTRCLGQKDRARAASKTFPGIAKAMAEQWSAYILGETNETQG